MSRVTLVQTLLSAGLVLLVPSAAKAQQQQQQQQQDAGTEGSSLEHLSQTSSPGAATTLSGPRTTSNTTTAGTGSVANTTTPSAPRGEVRGSTGPETDPSRPISAPDLARILQSHETAIHVCYDTERRSQPQLTGRINIDITLGSDGKITRLQVVGLPSAPKLLECVTQHLQTVSFPRPESGSLHYVHPVTLVPPQATPARGRSGRTRTRTR